MMEYRDTFYHLVRCRAAAEYVASEGGDEVDIWNSAVVALDEMFTVSDINESYPIIEESQYIDHLEDDSCVLLTTKPRIGNDRRMYIPVIPAELYNHSQFYIKDWGFLASC